MSDPSNSREPVRKPLVSVVICTYCRATLVTRAIDSVRNQTYRNLEIIVVDDASQDNTGNVVRDIPDERIRYLRHERNKGLPAARNTGIGAARGDYVAFLDDDDEWQPNKIRRQLDAIDGHGAVLSAALINGTRLKCHGRNFVELSDLRKKNDFDPSSLMARADVLKQVMFDDRLRQGEDWDVFIRLAERCSVGYVPEPLLLYSDGSHGRMTNEAKNLAPSELEKRMAMIHKHRDFFGSFWFQVHVAEVLLSYLWHRDGRLRQLREAVARCGVIPVGVVLTRKVLRSLSRAVGYA
jgi:GalNAc5-diNAcBac-PP-undecaprenol beta-1,3-glucosyltransferase